MAGSAHDRARTEFGFSGGFLPSAAPRPIDASTAVVTFLGAWVVAQLVSSVILTVLGDGDAATDASFGILAVALVGAWTSYLVGMWIASQRAGSGSMIADYGITFRWIDLAGLAIGAGSQLVLIRVVYLPLEALWPDTFTQDRLTENAQDLVDRAGGASTLLLTLVVVIGAPVVEELFYRGLLQRSLAARFNEVAVVVGVAAIFALGALPPDRVSRTVRVRPHPRLRRASGTPARTGDHDPHRVQSDRSSAGAVTSAGRAGLP